MYIYSHRYHSLLFAAPLDVDLLASLVRNRYYSPATVRRPMNRFDNGTIQCRVLARPPKLYVFPRSSVRSMLAAFARDIGIIRSWVGKHTHTHTNTMYMWIMKILFEVLKLLEWKHSTISKILIFVNFSVINRVLTFFTYYNKFNRCFLV